MSLTTGNMLRYASAELGSRIADENREWSRQPEQREMTLNMYIHTKVAAKSIRTK